MGENVRAVRLRVGRNVRRLRLLRGFSQERLAELVGNSGKHIGQVERGEVNVGIDILCRIAIALSADVSDLFIGARRSNTAEPAPFLITAGTLDLVDQALRAVKGVRTTRSR